MLLLAGSSIAQTPSGRAARPLAEFSAAIVELAHGASASVVQLTVQRRAPVSDDNSQHIGYVASQQATGSGVVVDRDGYIVTNAHVVDGARHIDVSVLNAAVGDDVDNHEHREGKLVGIDRETDLALIKVEGAPLPPLAFRDSNTVKQGQVVIAIGSPLGLENSLTVGFISAPERHLRPDRPMFYIQTDAPINPGNSGGPLLDVDGRIVGINTMIMSQSGGSEGIGFAIPSNLVQDVYEHLRKEGRVRRGAIGILPDDITPTLASALGLKRHGGVIISDVKPHGAAEAAGVEAGDIILAANGQRVRDARALYAAIFQRAIGDEVTLEVERNGERITKTVTIMERPSAPNDLTQLANEEGQLIRRLGVITLNLGPKTTAALGELRRLAGVVVAAIPAEYAALNPGLLSGDVIYELNGNRINTIDELRNALAAKSAGDAVALLVERAGQLQYVAFEIE
ncbi:MAG: trypsin-like peptidase domain-containing protein [Acidobacteria bacterium]|nr:trypsin-like peptidase domain-containing protein [Acidobacteriota bacterium]